MSASIFLSAGVPDPKRGPEHAATADTVAINAAISALVHVTLGRRPFVGSGHPAITPMVLEVAKSPDVDYGKWVMRDQLGFFNDEYLEENELFKIVVYTDGVDRNLGASLLGMRRRMFSEHEFSDAVFLGGMGGILEEFDLFKELQPRASLVPVISTGGAAKLLADQLSNVSKDLFTGLDYVALLHRHLDISTRERIALLTSNL
ncbi:MULTISPECIES: hypothetical protein [Falsihalocynthiibacter]|uniref:SLOG domain-containing protein n=1 Tax=Falsihalocynthiibacter TaxID=2854182 RepID=UPI003002809A